MNQPIPTRTNFEVDCGVCGRNIIKGSQCDKQGTEGCGLDKLKAMMSITKLDAEGIRMMIAFEGCVLHPYLDQVGIPTIGIGCTYYEDGRKVTMNDAPITQERANELFTNVSAVYANPVHMWTKPVLTQNQFNALFSLCYNIGTGGFRNSTVLRLVNQFVFDERLRAAFMLWDKADGRVIDDLAARRAKEYEVFSRPG